MNLLPMASIDLSNGVISSEEISDSDFKRYLGGNGLAIKTLAAKIKPGTDPLSPNNILFFGTGPLTGTGVYGSDRVCVAAKSPLTNLFFDSTMGGRFASTLRSTGYSALSISGRADTPSYLDISSSGIQIRDAGELVGKSPDAVREILSTRFEDFEVCATGIAGEKLARYGCIIHPRPGRRPGVAGRGGLGAVMGSKNLKAIVMQRNRDSKPHVFSDSKFDEVMRQFRVALKEKTPHLTDLGTPFGLRATNARGGFGTRNLQSEVFESAEDICGQTLKERYYKRNLACFSCPVACGKLLKINDKLVKSPEYETIYAFGGMLGIGHIEAVIEANRLCDEYGLDTISMGITLAFAFECFEKGIISTVHTDGRLLKFGDPSPLPGLIYDTAHQKGFGKWLAEGTRRMAEVLGQDSWKYAHQTKGLEIAGHSARMVKVLSLGYATNTRGGSHQDARGTYGPGMEEYDGKVEATINTQNFTAVGDSLLLCRFIMEGGLGRSLNENYSHLLEAVTGWRPTVKELNTIGERIVNLERWFNVREGVHRQQDILPYRVMHEQIPIGPQKGQRTPPEKLEEMLNSYYSLRGWDNDGVPLPETLERLELNPSLV